ncbi:MULTISPECIES: hypothetical protein [Kribbella]|nr:MULTISPECIES: hypothetical protein [Kribbella]
MPKTSRIVVPDRPLLIHAVRKFMGAEAGETFLCPEGAGWPPQTGTWCTT